MVHQDRDKRKGHSEDAPLKGERAKRRAVGVGRGQRSRLEVASLSSTGHVSGVKLQHMICLQRVFPAWKLALKEKRLNVSAKEHDSLQKGINMQFIFHHL